MGKLDFSSLRLDGLMAREWLATNANGGFASSTLCGLNSRKYHGLLVAAMSPPVRRMVLLSRVEETVRCGGETCELAVNEYPGVVHPRGYQYLRAFDSFPFPRWAYQGEGWTIEKQLRSLRGENSVVLSYTLLGGANAVELELRPLFAFRGIHDLMYQWNGKLDAEGLSPRHHRLPATSRSPEAFFAHDGAFVPQPCWYLNTIYRREQERGYAGLEDLWMPGYVKWTLSPGQSVHFVCSTDPIDFSRALGEADRQYERLAGNGNPPDEILDALLRAADQFVVHGRDGAPMIMSAYPWSPPSGRDVMICLPGLLLVTGRLEEARALLATFAGLARNGLMPAELAEDGSGWRYTAADTSLWFIHAVGQYLRYRGDEGFVGRELLPVVHQIIEAYRAGTELGIVPDADGLLQSRAPGTPTTWMDAKIGDWVITPRGGRPSSLNALWYNALCTAADLCQRFGQPERDLELLSYAARVKESFNRRFWNEAEGCCFDVVEDHGHDPSIRPDQLLAISLPHAVLDIARHAAVLRKAMAELLTPFGVRTLSPKDPSYQGHYGGPVVARDRAHHQGSAFPWLLGPLVSAFLRVNGHGQRARDEAARMVQGCLQYMQDLGTGQICELFDGDAPHRPGGAMASARSVAEILRCYAEDLLDVAPAVGTAQSAPGARLAPWPDRDRIAKIT